MIENRPLRVFLCHSSNDKPAVRELYQKLRAEQWIQPWLDEEELYPGRIKIWQSKRTVCFVRITSIAKFIYMQEIL
ncbi:MAG TPA: TIR domain-containing protein [Anaerolineales bacterium]|nr:TIR domain-containing protein [Anaerolineales bacterium]